MPKPIHYLDESIKSNPFAKLGLDFFLDNNRRLMDQWVLKAGSDLNAPIFWLPKAKKWVFNDGQPNHQRAIPNRANQVR